MKKNLLIVALLTGAFLISGCASKKDLENCQSDNRRLNSEYQNAKETIAANNARIKSLEDQLAQAKASAQALQGSLDKSLSNTNSTNINISKLVDQINESNQYIRYQTHYLSRKTNTGTYHLYRR